MKRFYEWRFESGARFGEPFLAADACEAWLLSHASGRVALMDQAKPGPTLHLHVSATGERVYIIGERGVRARLAVDGAEWRRAA